MSEVRMGQRGRLGQAGSAGERDLFLPMQLVVDHLFEQPLAIAASLALDRGEQVDQHTLRPLLPLGRAQAEAADDGPHKRQLHQLGTIAI